MNQRTITRTTKLCFHTVFSAQTRRRTAADALQLLDLQVGLLFTYLYLYSFVSLARATDCNVTRHEIKQKEGKSWYLLCGQLQTVLIIWGRALYSPVV